MLTLCTVIFIAFSCELIHAGEIPPELELTFKQQLETSPVRILPTRDASPAHQSIDAERFTFVNSNAVPFAPVGISHQQGPVMATGVNVYLIWYGNWSNEQSKYIITNFIKSLGPSNPSTPNSVRGWWDINCLYYDTAGNFLLPNITLKGEMNDLYSRGKSLVTTDVMFIAYSSITKFSFDARGVYLVLTSKDVSVRLFHFPSIFHDLHELELTALYRCGFQVGSFCAGACAYHGYYTIGYSSVLKYGFIGDPTDLCPYKCTSRTTPANGDVGADAMVSMIAHELTETATDPKLNAWYSKTDGKENADKCAWTFGPTFTSETGKFKL